MNRERTSTLESVDSHSTGGGLRERTNTAGSIRSTHSDDGGGGAGNADSTGGTTGFLRASIISSPQRGNANKRWNGIGGTTTTTTYRRLRQTVEWAQRQRVPPALYRQGKRTWQRLMLLSRRLSRSNGGNGNATGTPVVDVQEDTMYWIEGLDRVVFGTSAAAEVIRIAGVQPPRYLWYMISGAMCDIVQLCMDVALHAYVIEDASLCWAVTFFLSVAFRHTSHRYLVFGDYVGGYAASLSRMYAGYSVIIVLSTLFNAFLTRVVETPHYVAWILTLLWTGIANYFILKKLWSFGGR